MMNTLAPLIILITGASGSGKTMLLQELSKNVPEQSVKIFYFDDIGVPSVEEMINQYHSPEMWQKTMTDQWIERLSHIKNVQIILLEGSYNPHFAVNALKKHGLSNYRLFCVHSDRSIREQRLQHQRQQPELMTDDMENFAQFLKRTTVELGGVVIDNNASPHELVQRLLSHINM